MNTSNPKTILFIHGLFVTGACWDKWKKYFESLGYVCYVPFYPLKQDTAENLRSNIATGKIETLDFKTILAFYEREIKRLGEKPILIGHSMGGLLVQVLVHKGLAAAGVCIHSGPVNGLISLKWSFLKSNLSLILAPKSKPYLMPFKLWQYAFTNGMSLEDQKASYEAGLVPESPNIPVGATGKLAKVDFAKPHVPLLFTAGSIDNIIPPSLNKRNAEKYTDAQSITEFKEFAGRNHYVLQAPGWQEVAGYVAAWLDKVFK